MSIRIGINGYGRMGRLALRIGWGRPGLEFTQINETRGGPPAAAHLTKYDSVHGKWGPEVSHHKDSIQIDGKNVRFTSFTSPGEIQWEDVDLVLECSGKFRSLQQLQGHLRNRVQKVIVSAPVKEGALNIVMGINDDQYKPDSHHIITAASCTTNCLAPVIKVVHEKLGIRHGLITTIHDMTNTQRIVDAPESDLRRARAASLSLIPTTTGSATAIGLIYPELQGLLNGLAIRVPLLNASLTDSVFEVSRPTSVEEVNGFFEESSKTKLKGILGFEKLPLVSIDYRSDPRSAIVDALSTMVVNRTQVKVIAWYDNEWGYTTRMIELAQKVGTLMVR